MISKTQVSLAGSVLFLHPKIDSTNLEAERFLHTADEGALHEGAVFIAKIQTNGQGSFYRKWVSDLGGLYYSLLMPCSEAVAQTNALPQIATCVRDVLFEFTHLPVEVDHPNDLVVGDKKIGGILLKTLPKQMQHFIIIGIGINLNQSSFSDEIHMRATSVFQLTKKRISQKAIATPLTLALKKCLVSL